ncbi:tetratricopeptide repeat protein [Azospirillum sp.]|uniref:tetratricopeptide repeat protein n=1 Tax=Azospirillum sp. TaxID=34012 RepID=UPI00261BD2F3|nr:tetratricopeptide repeat protein [Azospirillum sp.]
MSHFALSVIGASLLSLLSGLAIADQPSSARDITADHGGIVVNGNVAGSVGLTPVQLKELMVEYARQESAAIQRVEALSKQLGVTEAALGGFFKTLEQNDVPPEQLAVRLSEIARDRKKLLAELAIFRGEDDPDVARLSADAESALLANRNEDARRLLTEAKAANIAAADRLSRAMNTHKRRAAEKAAALGNLANSEIDYPRAAAAFTEAAALCPSDDALLRPDYLNSAAAAEYRAGRYPAAVPLLTEALAIREKALGPDHPDTALSLNNLGYLYRAQGKLADAAPLYTRALAIREKALGSDHPDTALSLNNLAYLYRAQGKLADAAPLYTRALAITEKAFGPDHPATALSLNNLAELYRAQGKLADAAPLHTRALAIREKALGPDHPDTASSLNNLAGLYRAQGKLDAAAPLYTRALAIREKALGPDHPTTRIILGNLAVLRQEQGRIEDAAALFADAEVRKARWEAASSRP